MPHENIHNNFYFIRKSVHEKKYSKKKHIPKSGKINTFLAYSEYEIDSENYNNKYHTQGSN